MYQNRSRFWLIGGIIALIGAGSCNYLDLVTIRTWPLPSERLVFMDATSKAGLNHSTHPAFAITVVDYDNDGDLDVFINNHHRHFPFFYENKGDGAFLETSDEVGINTIKNVGVGKWLFEKPSLVDKTTGFFIWHDALNEAGTMNNLWHLRWSAPADSNTSFSGTLSTNSEFLIVSPTPRVGDQTNIFLTSNSIHFEATSREDFSALDFECHSFGATIFIDLYINGERAKDKIFIGRHNQNPDETPFSLVLGDRHGCAWGDYDNDGNIDLFITRGALWGKLAPPMPPKQDELFKNDGQGRFSNLIANTGIDNAYTRGRSAQWIDFDQDGDLDLYIGNFESHNLLYKNNGDGTFMEVAGPCGLDFLDRAHFIWADYNNDGYEDVFFTNPDGLFQNNGNGTFSDVTARSGIIARKQPPKDSPQTFWGSGASFADYDNDGDLDLFMAGGEGYSSTLFENNQGRFTDVTLPAGLEDSGGVIEGIWGDVDNDGYVDLYVISKNETGSNRLFRNNGNRTFTDVTDAGNLNLTNRPSGKFPFQEWGAAAWLDYDNDGFLDLLIGKGEQVLFKNMGNTNHWIKIKLMGIQSNYNGIGTKVYVATPAGVQFQEAGSYDKTLYSQSCQPIHFGLGETAVINYIKIVWPTGLIQVIKNVMADQTVSIKEAS